MPVRRLVPACLLGLLTVAFVGADDLSTATGKRLSGTLVGVDQDGVTFRVGAVDEKVAAKDILVVDFGRPVAAVPKEAKYHELQLTDGSNFRVGRFLLKGKRVEVEFLPGPANVPVPTFDLPLGGVAHLMRNADDPKARDEWRRLLAARGKRDLYVVRQADGLNTLPGTVLEGSADGATIKFETEGGKVDDLRLSRATGGLVFNPPQPAALPPTVCKVHDVWGNVLLAQSVKLADGGFVVTTVSGLAVTYPQAAGLSKLDYSQGNIAYLSDLAGKADGPAAEPGTEDLPPVVRDAVLGREAAAGDIQLGGAKYPKGLAVRRDAALSYTLGGDYREFKAVVGFRDAQDPAAAALKLTVEADGRVLLAEVVRGADKPKPLALDVKNVQTLRLLVEPEGAAEIGNYLILADAKVVK